MVYEKRQRKRVSFAQNIKFINIEQCRFLVETYFNKVKKKTYKILKVGFTKIYVYI